jgi:TRAP-type C4-dicarboxylate transport system substrate-binding protein
MSNKRTIRWVIAHHPVELFKRTAELFKQELEKECPNQFNLEIYTPGTYDNKFKTHPEFRLTPPDVKGLQSYPESYKSALNNEEVKQEKSKDWSGMKKRWTGFFNALRDGEFEISQTQVGIVGSFLNANYHAIDLPFLFNSHDHVSEVLDGQIGDDMGNNLSITSGVRGLAFTYSGGYRVIGAKKGLTALSDLSALKLLTNTAHSDQLFNTVGAKTLRKKDATIEDVADMSESDDSAIETTYLRFDGKNVLKTNHSMFTTTILTGNKFWNTLTLEQQAAFKRIAKVVAKEERKWSLQDAAAYEANAKANGVTITEVSKSDIAKLKESSKAVYSNIENMGINKSLVDTIILAGSEKAVNA